MGLSQQLLRAFLHRFASVLFFSLFSSGILLQIVIGANKEAILSEKRHVARLNQAVAVGFSGGRTVGGSVFCAHAHLGLAARVVEKRGSGVGPCGRGFVIELHMPACGLPSCTYSQLLEPGPCF